MVLALEMGTSAQAESVIKNIIREICLECSSQGEYASETLAAFMVRVCTCSNHTQIMYVGACGSNM